MHGEAIALRAQCYRDLIRLLGDVPFKVEATKTDLSNVYLPKTDRFVIMERLIEQLLQYAGELPWRQDTPERISQGYGLDACRLELLHCRRMGGSPRRCQGLA